MRAREDKAGCPCCGVPLPNPGPEVHPHRRGSRRLSDRCRILDRPVRLSRTLDGSGRFRRCGFLLVDAAVMDEDSTTICIPSTTPIYHNGITL